MSMITHTWKSKGFRDEKSFKKFLKYLYITQGFNALEIATLIKVSKATVCKWFNRYGFSFIRSPFEAAVTRNQKREASLVFPAKFNEVLDGLMLGDGHIGCRSKSGVSGFYSHSSNHHSHIKSVISNLKPLDFLKIYPDNGCWYVKSRCYDFMAVQRNRWYPSGKKRVPRDLKLTPVVCYWWFVGDGSIEKNSYLVKLSTNAFTKSGVIRLQTLLEGIGIKASIIRSNELRIGAASVDRFFEYIGKCNNPEYSYKWIYTTKAYKKSRRKVKGKG